MTTVWAISLTIWCTLNVPLTLLGLPGIWLMVLGALGLNLYQPGTFSWWTLAIAATLALIGEIAEMAAGAAGAKAAGSSKRAATGAIVGGIIGGIMGTVMLPIPIVGTILGAAIGSGLAAAALELTLADRRSIGQLAKVGSGAAAGRLVAVVIKGAIAAAVAALLSVAVWVR